MKKSKRDLYRLPSLGNRTVAETNGTEECHRVMGIDSSIGNAKPRKQAIFFLRNENVKAARAGLKQGSLIIEVSIVVGSQQSINRESGYIESVFVSTRAIDLLHNFVSELWRSVDLGIFSFCMIILANGIFSSTEF